MLGTYDSHGRHVCGYDLNILLSSGSLSFSVALVQYRGSGPSPENYPLGGEAHSPKQKGEKSDGVELSLVNIFFMNMNTQQTNM